MLSGALVLGAVGPCSLGEVQAAETEVPHGVQAQLLAKVSSYDYGFRERAGSVAHVLIVVNPDEPASVRSATLLEAALLRQESIAGLKPRVTVTGFTDAKTLTTLARAERVSLAYVTTGLENKLESICSALQQFGVLTFTETADYVRRCCIVGFQLLGGRPKLLIHLQHAKDSGIRFRSELLALAKVYR